MISLQTSFKNQVFPQRRCRKLFKGSWHPSSFRQVLILVPSGTPRAASHQWCSAKKSYPIRSASPRVPRPPTRRSSGVHFDGFWILSKVIFGCFRPPSEVLFYFPSSASPSSKPIGTCQMIFLSRPPLSPSSASSLYGPLAFTLGRVIPLCLEGRWLTLSRSHLVSDSSRYDPYIIIYVCTWVNVYLSIYIYICIYV